MQQCSRDGLAGAGGGEPTPQTTGGPGTRMEIQFPQAPQGTSRTGSSGPSVCALSLCLTPAVTVAATELNHCHLGCSPAPSLNLWQDRPGPHSMAGGHTSWLSGCRDVLRLCLLLPSGKQRQHCLPHQEVRRMNATFRKQRKKVKATHKCQELLYHGPQSRQPLGVSSQLS